MPTSLPRWCIVLLLLTSPLAHAIKDGEVFQDWRAKCVTTENSAKPSCHIFQDLIQKESGKRVLHMAIGQLPDKQSVAVIITLPLGISLPPGLNVRVDKHDARQIPLQSCFANGCQAAFELDAQWKAQLTKGNAAEVIFYNLKGQPIGIPVSLKGISAALRALQGSK